MENSTPSLAPPPSQISSLQRSLHDLHFNPYPHVPNPQGCQKRASVALVLRVRPSYPHLSHYIPPSSASSPSSTLSSFFAQPWVQTGDPEVLFIKRAARKGDRWTSHIAFPGGKREANDANDRATSERETREETGLELDTEHCLYIGNLPERVLTTTWGKVPLMVLCPFVYLLLRHDIPPLALQPTEVHSAHWVPLRAIVAPEWRTYERTDVSDRFSRQGNPLIRCLIRATAGQMLFSAVRLKPSESLYCSSGPECLPEPSSGVTTSWTQARELLWPGYNGKEDANDQRLILWGLSLGILADFLTPIDQEGAARLWSWPTLTAWDIRLAVWLFTYKFRNRKLKESDVELGKEAGRGVRMGEMDDSTFTTKVERGKRSEAGVAGGHLLEGYGVYMRRGIVAALVLRVGIAAMIARFLVRNFRQSRLYTYLRRLMVYPAIF